MIATSAASDVRQADDAGCLAYQPVVVRSPRARDGRGLRGLRTPGAAGMSASPNAFHMPGCLRVEDGYSLRGEKGWRERADLLGLENCNVWATGRLRILTRHLEGRVHGTRACVFY
jgi:hypothetical protein